MRFTIESPTDDGSFKRTEVEAVDIIEVMNEHIGQVDKMLRQDWGYVVYDMHGRRLEVEVNQREA